jgi:hypothetical protein
MTVTLHLTPELEADLSARARNSGMGLESYLLTLVKAAALPSASAQHGGDQAEAVHSMLEFREKRRLSMGEPVTRALMHEGFPGQVDTASGLTDLNLFFEEMAIHSGKVRGLPDEALTRESFYQDHD